MNAENLQDKTVKWLAVSCITRHSGCAFFGNCSGLQEASAERSSIIQSFRLFHRCNLSDVYLALLHVVCRLRLFGVSWQCVKYRFDVFVMSQRQHFADADCGPIHAAVLLRT